MRVVASVMAGEQAPDWHAGKRQEKEETLGGHIARRWSVKKQPQSGLFLGAISTPLLGHDPR